MTDPACHLSIASVALVVHDLGRVAAFYEDAIGLQRLDAGPDDVRLGVDGRVLVDLHRDAAARVRSPREAGLFHTAILLPTRADLGRWTARAAQRRLPIQGGADHGVSEAIYLADPEGNGVEVYADRARSVWHWSEGLVTMSSDPLDTEGLMRTAGKEAWAGAPSGTIVGHVHLQVGAIPAAEAFYSGVLGLALTCRYPGGSFFAADGYHHHVATNIWNSRNAAPRRDRTTGLAELRMRAADAATIAAIATRAADARLSPEQTHGRLALRDPWAIPLAVSE